MIYIRTKLVKLLAKKTSFEFDLSKEYYSSNVLVEITGGGKTKSLAYSSHSLNVQVVENYGQVKVTHQEINKPLPRTFVNVYALDSFGRVKFYKDDYNDLIGRLDFNSPSTNELDNVRKFSVLILSDNHGAIVTDAMPPKRRGPAVVPLVALSGAQQSEFRSTATHPWAGHNEIFGNQESAYEASRRPADLRAVGLS